MKKTNIIILIAVLVLALILIFSFSKNNKTPPNAENNNPTDRSDVIVVATPKPNDLITNPLIIKGKNKGWYFEGSFGVKLLDATGKVLGASYVQADGEWMTAEWVPFTGTLEYDSAIETTGTLVFEKDNPSDMRQFDDSYSFPVRISKTETLTVKAFFNKPILATESCDAVQTPVERIIPKTTNVARAAISELLEGPTRADLALSLATGIPPGTKLNSIEIRNDTAYVDFNETLQYQVGGSCRVGAIRAQIEDTLKQFVAVKNVSISINGKTEDILQP